jgi:hypothetical protein
MKAIKLKGRLTIVIIAGLALAVLFSVAIHQRATREMTPIGGIR